MSEWRIKHGDVDLQVSTAPGVQVEGAHVGVDPVDAGHLGVKLLVPHFIDLDSSLQEG
jgi:hypothetical protein